MTKISIATWNVNSVKARLPNVVEWLNSSKTDIVLLQELKCMEEAFPRMEIEDCGYNVAISGQKTYNGVAILSRFPIDDVIRGIPEYGDEAARYIEGVINVGKEAIRVASVYVPNGMSPDSEKFQYKMNFFDELHTHLKNLRRFDEKVFIGGDYNCAPDDMDVYDPRSLRGTTCFHPAEQEKFRKLLNAGYLELFRKVNPDNHSFSWWDYRAGAFNYNKGMRIDHILANPKGADCVVDCVIDAEPRAKEKASDHTPVICTINLD